jgi:hypothetical protein
VFFSSPAFLWRYAGYRYFMGTQMHAPYRIVRGSTAYWFMVCLPINTKEFKLYRFTESDSPAMIVHPMRNILGHNDAQLWGAQVTAWAAAPNCATGDSVEKVILSFIEWDETSSATMLWSKTTISCANFSPAGEYDAGAVSSIVLDDPTGVADMARVCVSLWTPPGGALAARQETTCQFTVAVLFNRATLQRPCYGLGIIKCSSGITITAGSMFGSAGYSGPVSSMPFAGFARCYDDVTSFYFTDQATGQVWKCTAATTTPVWTLANKGMQIHSSEFCQSSLVGQTCVIDSLYESVLWGLAPGPSADITGGYPLRDSLSSSSRHKPGLYPLVQLSRKIADAVEVADFSGMTAFEALVALRQCAWDYRIFFTVNASKVALINFAKITDGSYVCKLVPLDMSPIPSLLESTPEVGFMSGWSRKLLPVKNAVDVVPYGPTGAGDFVSSVVKAAGSTFDTDYLVSCTTERPLRVAIICVSGGDVLAPSSTVAALQKPILWTWERMRETAHCWLASACVAAAEYVWVSGVTTKGGVVYCGEAEVVVGDWIAVGGGDRKRITSIPVIGSGSVRVDVGAATIGIAASAYSEVTIEPHESRASGTSDEGAVVLAAVYTLSPTPGTTMTVASVANIEVGAVLWCRSYAWKVTAITGTTLTVSTLYFPAAPVDAGLGVGAKISACVYTQACGKLYAVGKTGVMFGIATPEDDVAARTVSPGDGVIVTAAGMRLDKLKGCSIRKLDKASIGDESAGTGYGRCDVSISDTRFVDALRAEMLASKVLVDASPRVEVTSIKIPAIWPTLTIGSNVSVSDPRITAPVSGVETEAGFSVTGIRYDLANVTSELTIRSVAAANVTGKTRGAAATRDSAMPAGRQGEE